MANVTNQDIMTRINGIETAIVAMATAIQALTVREVASVAAAVEAPASPKATTATAEPKAKATPKATDVVTCCAIKGNGKRCMQRFFDKTVQSPLVNGRCQYHQDAAKNPAAHDGIVTIPAPVAAAPAAPKATTATTSDRAACRGTKANGDPCSSTILNPAGYCKHHVSQKPAVTRKARAK